MQNFQNKLNPFFNEFQEIMEKSWVFTLGEYSHRPLARDKIWRAKTMHGHIKAFLFEKYPDYFYSEKGSFYMELEGYKLHFRKFNNRLCPSRPLTERAKSLQGYCQLRIDFGDQYEVSSTPIFIGYQLNYTEELISGVYAVKLSEGKPEWILPISKNLESSHIVTFPSNEERLVRPKQSLLGTKKATS